jgi:hypothetical protein
MAGVGAYLNQFAPEEEVSDFKHIESVKERRQRKTLASLERHKAKLAKAIEECLIYLILPFCILRVIITTLC